MKHGGKMLVLGGLTLCAAAQAIPAESPDSPYQGIVDRNVFGLKPPPPPPDPSEANKPQALKITLTGITDILGKKMALMKTPPAAVKPGEQAKGEQYYMLTVGQRDGEIEVMDIDIPAGSVKVNNAGTIATLTLEKDGAKLPASPAPALPTAVPGQPGMVPPPLAAGKPFVPGAVNPAGANPGFTLPSRIPRLPGAPGSAPMSAGFSSYNGSAAASQGSGNPALTFPGYGTPSTTTPTQPATPQITPEEQAIMMEVMREKNRGNPNFPPLPPTPLNSGLNNGPPGVPGRPPPLPQ
jgi:hypothetical protein